MSLFTNAIDAVINEIRYFQWKAKQNSITRLFPTFKQRVRDVASKGGIKALSVRNPDTWMFDVASSSEKEPGKSYAVWFHFTNIPDLLKKWVPVKAIWNSDKTNVNYSRLAQEIFNDVDMQSDCECLTGDTKVPMLDGRTLTMKEIAEEYKDGKEFWIIASDLLGDPVPAKARSTGITGRYKNLIEVTLDNNEKIRCTAKHLFRMRDGSYKMATDLKEQDSLMPYYTHIQEPSGKYSQPYMWVKLNSKTTSKGGPSYKSLHRIVAESVLVNDMNKKYDELIATKLERGLTVHHKDFRTFNNCPENLQWMGVKEHWLYHALVGKENATKAVIAYHKDPANRQKIHEDRARAARVTNARHPELLKKFNEAGRNSITKRNNTYWSNAENRERMSQRLKGVELSESHCHNLKKSWTLERREAARQRMIERNQTCVRDASGRNNHKVASVRHIRLDSPEFVYDLTVDTYQNFALSAGVFVHNCAADTYWGSEYIKTQKKSQYGEDEDRPPVVRNPKQYGIMCKHAHLVWQQLPMYAGTMAKHLKEFWKDEIDEIVKQTLDAEKEEEQPEEEVPAEEPIQPEVKEPMDDEDAVSDEEQIGDNEEEII